MSAPDNQFFGLQQRLVYLLRAHAYFAALGAGEIITEQPGDVAFLTADHLLQLGFGVVITQASGKPIESSYEALITLEDINLTLTHHPEADPLHNVTDALAAAIAAIHGKSVQAIGPAAPRPHDYFRVVGHQKRTDAPSHLSVHELHLQAGLRHQ